MALEFAIFRVEADACTWQESSRSLAAAKARAELPGAVASSLVYKHAFEKGPARLSPCCSRQCITSAVYGSCECTRSATNCRSGTSSRSLPDSPLPKSGPQSPAQQTPAAEGSASVEGTVLDVSGATVPGAEVSLTHRDGTQAHTMVYPRRTANLTLQRFFPVSTL